MGANRVIGLGGQLPWKLSADLRYFKQVTMGKPIMMGRRTHESIGRPLPGRTNIVLTGDRSFRAPGCVVAHSLAEALATVSEADEIMVIGGANLYAQTLSHADRLYLTEIHHTFDGDTWLPEIDMSKWRESRRDDHGADADSPYAYSFLRYERGQ